MTFAFLVKRMRATPQMEMSPHLPTERLCPGTGGHAEFSLNLPSYPPDVLEPAWRLDPGSTRAPHTVFPGIFLEAF